MPISTTAATFGDLLRQLRRRAGLTQRELATLVGFSISQISLLEKNQRLPDLLLLSEKFAPALGLADEPRLLQKLLQLAAQARGERPPLAVQVERTLQVQTTVREEWVEDDALLPAALTSLLARRQEIDQAIDRLMRSPGRLVTLIGPPGVGKTRLALAVAEQLQPLLADGACLVPLAAVTQPHGVVTAIVTALHLPDAGNRTPLQRLVDYLRHKEMLLVLDDFEHLLVAAAVPAPLTGAAAVDAFTETRPETVPASAAASLVRLLESCPRLRLLVTSRQPLRVRAEQRLKVQPLPLAAAVELFLRRAEAVEPEFAPAGDELAAITQLCLRLDCLPLAIELVAARIDLFSPQAMLARLHSRRLDLLDAGLDDLPAHQSTLRGAIQRSYALLDAREQQLFCACALFAGSFDLPALAACAGVGDAESGIQSLAVKSLVKTVSSTVSSADGERRFVLLETLRAYAAEQLAAGGAEDALRQRHAHYYATWAQRIAAAGDMLVLGREHHNLMPALQWLVRHDGATALLLVAALREFWYSRGLFDEGRTWAQAALDAAGQAVLPGSRAAALLALGQMLLNQGETVAAQAALHEAVQLLRRLRDLGGCARALIELGWAVYLGRDEQASAAHFAESLALAQQLDDTGLAAHALTSLTHVLVYEGAYTPQLRAYIEQSIALYRRLQDAHGLAQALLNLCTFHMQTGDHAAALEAGREAQQVADGAQLTSTRAWAYAMLAELLLMEGAALDEAHMQLEAALRFFQEASQRDGVLIVQHHLGELARQQGRWEDAVAYFEASHTAAAAGSDRRMMARCQIGLGQVALARSKREMARRCFAEAQQLLDALPAFLPAAALDDFRAAQLAAAA